MRRQDALGFTLGLLGMLCFAGTLPATRVAVPYLDPWFLTLARAAIAGIIAVALLAWLGRRFPSPRQFAEIAIASACLVYGFPLFSALAMETAPVAHGGVVLGVLPLGTAAAATLVAGERPSAGFWLAAAFGSALVLVFTFRHGMGGVVRGDAWLLAAIISAAFGYTCAGKLSSSMPGWEAIAWALVISLPVAVPGTLALWPSNAANVALPAWGGLVYVALVSQLLGFVFWNTGLALGGIARVGQVQLLQPFVIVALAAIVNGEPIEAVTLGFAVAVIATVFIGSRMRVRRDASLEAPIRDAVR